MSETITLVIHGTFAEQAEWWRLGSEGQVTFADRLEVELSGRGLSDTVWKPALQNGFDYPSFSWSGLNRHRDRIRGARLLSSNLNQLAQRIQATREAPLTVNFVAHSHGGNVVLEALRHLQKNVRVGRIALLGTPLVTTRPAFRIARFVFSVIMLGILFGSLLGVLMYLGYFVFTGHPFVSEQLFERGGEIVRSKLDFTPYVLLGPLVIIFYGWSFWAIGNLLDVTWRIICRVGQPIASIREKARDLVYGPSPSKLATILGRGPILIITTPNDEADLLLQIGSAPARLYQDYVATKLSVPKRLLEFAFIRPFVLGVFLKAIEMVLEVISLGFSIWRALLQDFDIASHTKSLYYPAHLLVHESLDVRPRTGTQPSLIADPTGQDAWIKGDRGLDSLSLSLQQVTDELKRQIRLRHSTYYDDEATIVRVAEFLTGADARGNDIGQPSEVTLSSAFWEGFLIANVISAVVCARMLDYKDEPFIIYVNLFFMLGYIIPFLITGLGLVIYLAARRQMPARSWSWHRILWALWAFVVLLGLIWLHWR
jgi:hypothetical protein